MRQATHYVETVKSTHEDHPDVPKILGLSLGFEFCSEHGSGIHDLAHTLGFDTEPNKLEDTIPMDCDEMIAFKELPSTKTGPAEAWMIISGRKEYRDLIDLPRNTKHIRAPIRLGSAPVAASWGSGGMFIRAFDEESRYVLKTLHDALRVGCVSIVYGCGHPHRSGGLTLLLLENLSPKERDTFNNRMKARQDKKKTA